MFNGFKCKCTFSITVEGTLQMSIAVITSAQCLEVLFSATFEIDGLADVDRSVASIPDAVDAADHVGATP